MSMNARQLRRLTFSPETLLADLRSVYEIEAIPGFSIPFLEYQTRFLRMLQLVSGEDLDFVQVELVALADLSDLALNPEPLLDRMDSRLAMPSRLSIPARGGLLRVYAVALTTPRKIRMWMMRLVLFEFGLLAAEVVGLLTGWF